MIEDIRYFKVTLDGIETMSASTSRAYPRHIHDQYGIGVPPLSGIRSFGYLRDHQRGSRGLSWCDSGGPMARSVRESVGN